MSGKAATAGASPLRSLRRDSDNRVIAGVCAGVALRFGLDPLLVRIAFVVAATAGGIGIALYALGWLFMPADEAGAIAPRRMPPVGRRAVEVALGVGFLLLAALLALRETGIWFSDAIVWPVVLVAAGGALLWRQSAVSPTREMDRPREEAPRVRAARAAVISRTGIGIALVIAAGFIFLQATGALSAARDVVLAVIVVVVVLGVIFAPWVLRLLRSLSAERAERVRSQERAEMAAHLHDSVLQTLALVQNRAGSEREVASLARRQERELRSWLSGRDTASEAENRLVAALELAAAEIEQGHGVAVQVVAVGDHELDGAGRAVVAAAREAILNAAKFGGGCAVDVYVEAGEERLTVFVRDRGPGFDPTSVPEDRRGVRDSIAGRMARHGGVAHVRSSPGAGTEIELVLEREK